MQKAVSVKKISSAELGRLLTPVSIVQQLEETLTAGGALFTRPVNGETFDQFANRMASLANYVGEKAGACGHSRILREQEAVVIWLSPKEKEAVAS